MSQNQEKLYIDVDEEITTVVDRLRHSPAQSVSVVVPQRAVLLQSIVNLKLLGREAKKIGKNLILMTKDEEGIVFASRAGIEVQPFVGSEENLMQQDLQSENYFSAAPYQDTQQDSDNFFQEEEIIPQRVEQRPISDGRERKGQSMDFSVKRKICIVSDSLRGCQYDVADEQEVAQEPQEFVDNSPAQQYQDSFQQEESQSFNSDSNDFYDQNQNQQNHEEDSYYSNQQQDYSQDLDQEQSSFYDEPAEQLYKPQQQEDTYQNTISRDVSPARPDDSELSYRSRRKPKADADNKWYSKNKKDKKKKTSLSSKKQEKDYNKSGSGFFSKWVVAGGLLIIVLIGSVIVFPKTTLIVKIKEVDIEEKVNLTAKTDQDKVDTERMIIPARQIKKEVVYTKSFDSTGKADVDAQKAQGMVTIYNEYSEQGEKLVKTTRFLSEDGVLFRLADNVTIPGMTEVDGKKEPGKVKVLLVADKSGDGGNIEATTFRIVAYEKTDKQKYQNLYAKSDSKMLGGGTGGKDMAVVRAEDINSAKEVMEKSLLAFIESEMTDLVRDEEVLSKDAIDYKIIGLGSKVVKDTAVSKFEYEVTAQVTALVFSQKDIDELVYHVVGEKNKEVEISNDNIDVRYNSFKPEFDAGNLKMVAEATAKFKPEFDVDKFRDDIVGKNYDEIGTLIKENYKQIDSDINPEVLPSFLSGNISQVKQMTEVTVE